MQSEHFRALTERVRVLKRRYLPPIKTTGSYTPAQQDQMRALRLLTHAEFEHYLEEGCLQLVSDLERELASPKRGRRTERVWASEVVRAQRAAVAKNNGITGPNILTLFSNFGLTKEVLDEAAPLLLDRMTDFGRQRGDVAHHSAAKATYLLNRRREEKFIDEIVNHFKTFDSIVCAIRLRGFLSEIA